MAFEKRYIVQISACALKYGDVCYALCSDGALMRLDEEDASWREMPTIPQPKYAEDE